MERTHRILLGGIAVLALNGTTPVLAAEQAHSYYPNYSAKHGAPLSGEQRLQIHVYNEYEEREPCQNYREPPAGFYVEDCTLKYGIPVADPAPVYTQTETVTTTTKLKTVAEYNIYFDFDKSDLDPADFTVLDQIAGEIDDYQPLEVTVAGHTDTRGNADYNYKLSQRRADTVSQALTERGVKHRVIREEAFGESRPAVQTPDGVKLPENRRVEIEFLK